MKLLTAPKYLSEAIAPLMTLNYLLGLRIIEYPRGKLCITPTLIYLLLVLGIYIYCVSIQEQQPFDKQIQLLQLEYVLYKMLKYLYIFVIVYKMIFGCFYTKQFNACYRQITQIDDTLRELGSVFNYREINFFTVSGIIVCILYIIIFFTKTIIKIKSLTDMSNMIWIIVTRIYGISISSAVILEFSMFVKCLQTRFKLVNELLSENVSVKPGEEMKMGLLTENYSKIINTSEQHQNNLSIRVLSQKNLNKSLQQSRIQTAMWRKRNFIRSQARSRLSSQLQNQLQMELQSQFGNQTGDSKSIRKSILIGSCDRKRKHLLQTMRQVHLELCRVSKTLCTSFGMQIISEIGISVIIITAILYILYDHLIREHDKIGINSENEALPMIIGGITYILKTVFMSHICKEAIKESKKINEIIHTIYGCYEDVDIREEIQQFGLQIMQCSMDLITFGISLNYRVLCSCLKTVTIYVVIMVQMSDSLELTKNHQKS